MKHEYRNPHGFDYNAYTHPQRVDLTSGRYATVKADYDNDSGRPWEECDGNIVGIREAKRDSSTGYVDKKPGERVLHDGGRRGYLWVYDFNESVKVAKLDKWDTEPYGQGTPGERAVRAVLANAKWLAGWCNNDWHWMGVIVTLYDADDNEIDEESLWSIESDTDYWCEVATDMIENLEATALSEDVERDYWAARDVMTEVRV